MKGRFRSNPYKVVVLLNTIFRWNIVNAINMNVSGNVINAIIIFNTKWTSVVPVYIAFFMALTNTIIYTIDMSIRPRVINTKKSMKYFRFQKPTQLFTHGQWWSIFNTQVRQLEQWWVRYGLKLWHIKQYFLGIYCVNYEDIP